MSATVAIQRIPSFFINNDASGPYQEIPLFKSTPGPLSFLDVRTVIAVAPPEVTLRGEDAERMATECIARVLEEQPDPKKPEKFKDILPLVRPEFGPWLQQRECRTYLMRSVQLQQELRLGMQCKNIPGTVGEKLLILDYPKYVWVTEVSSPILLNQPDKEQRMCLGCVIADSTAPSRTAGVIAMHFADLFLAQDRDNSGKAERAVFMNSTPFKHRYTQA